MFCAQCGQQVADGARFCNHCGAPTVVVPPPAAAPPPAPTPAPPSPQAATAAPPARPTPAPTAPPAVAAYSPPSGGQPASASPPPPPPPGGAGTGAGFGGSFDSAQASELARGIFGRVKAILLSPSTEWPVIAAEATDSSAIYLRYVAPLVAIGVIATFLGTTLIGTSLGPFGHFRVGIVFGLGNAILIFCLSFVQVFIVSWLVNALAPTFGGRQDPLAALKVTAYSFTPGWVAAVLNLLPALGVLAVLAGLYGLYLLYLGLPVLMRAPKEKAVGYTVVVILCAVALSVFVTFLSTCTMAGIGGVAGLGALSRNGGLSDAAVAKTDTAGALANIFGGKTDADRERVSDAMKTLEKIGEQAKATEKAAGADSPQASAANAASAAAAMNAVGQIMAGGKDIQPVDFHELKAMLPAALPGMQRSEASGQSGEAMGMKGSSAKAQYSDGANARISIEIVDLGSMSGLAALAGKFDPNVEKETDTGYERTRRVDGQLVHERYDRRAKNGEVGVIVASRFSVNVEGSGVDPTALAGALKAIDLSTLEAMTTAKK
jgi:hypothetical protein